ncbi:MAG TPA: hypothetical protein VJ792_05835 [Candidatus Nitrosotalea sp.]|nr:hypothetical protein [Candidatus Nitrosotalea sp.]
MASDGCETTVLALAMSLLIWYVTLPYDNAVFASWYESDHHAGNGYEPEAQGMTRSIEEKARLCDAGCLAAGVGEVAVYLAIPSAIIYKMFVKIRARLGVSSGFV